MVAILDARARSAAPAPGARLRPRSRTSTPPPRLRLSRVVPGLVVHVAVEEMQRQQVDVGVVGRALPFDRLAGAEVQISAPTVRQPLVGGVAHQCVAEAVEAGAVLGHEVAQPPPGRRAGRGRLVQKLLRKCRAEAQPQHRCHPQQAAIGCDASWSICAVTIASTVSGSPSVVPAARVALSSSCRNSGLPPDRRARIDISCGRSGDSSVAAISSSTTFSSASVSSCSDTVAAPAGARTRTPRCAG